MVLVMEGNRAALHQSCDAGCAFEQPGAVRGVN